MREYAMNKKELKQFIDDFYQAWKERDVEKIPTYYAKDIKAYSDFQPITMEDILNRLDFSKKNFDEVNYNIQDMFIDEEAGKVSVRMKQRHLAKSGNIVKWESIMLYTIADHKIKKLWMTFYPNANYTDNEVEV